MGLEFIPNQPWTFESRNEYQHCKRTDSACNLIADGDQIFLQMKNVPCGGSLLCDTDFSGEEGDLVVNGNFQQNDDGWTSSSPEWTYNSLGYMDILTTGSQPIMFQSVAGGVTDGHCYVVRFTILNYVSGSITPYVGGVAGTPVSANGEYGQVIIPGSLDELISFSPDLNSEMSITGIQLYDMGFCWCPDNGQLFHLPTGENKMCHIPGAQTILTQVGVTPPIVNGSRYQVKITISGSTAGTVHYILGAAAVSIDFAGNGTFTDYVIADGDDNFQIAFSSDFDGCITGIDVEKLTDDYGATIIDSDGNFVFDLSPYFIYNKGYVFLVFDTSIFDFSHGCYRLSIVDPCAYQSSFNYITNGDFSANANWFGSCYFGTWFTGSEAEGVATGSVCTPTELVQSNLNGLVTGVKYIARVKYKSNFVDAGNNIRFDVCGTTVANLSPTTSYQQFTSIPFEITNPANQIRFHFDYGNITAGNSITIDDVEIFAVTPDVSNCFNWQTEHSGTRLIKAIDRISTDPSDRYSFGFYWPGTVFFLQQRVLLDFRKPVKNSKFVSDRYSTGKYYKSYVEQSKRWEMLIRDLDETQHDAMAVMLQCKSWSIDGVEYFNHDEEYDPTWDEKGYNNTADVKQAVSRLQDVIFADNCNR